VQRQRAPCANLLLRLGLRLPAVPRRLLLLLLFHGLIAWRLLPDLPAAAAAAMAAWLIGSALLIPRGFAGRRAHADRARDHVTFAGLLALGSFSTLLVLTLGRDVTLLLVAMPAALGLPAPDAAAWRATSALLVPAATLLLTAIGFFNARRRARVRTVEVPIAGLPAPLAGFTIAQITDLHIGPTIRRPYVEAVVRAVNALDADMIAITGDIVDGSVPALSRHAAPLAQLAARHGTFFVTGNHEYYSGALAWVAELRRLGMRVLVNEHVVLRHAGERVVVAGVTDPSAHHFHPAHRSDPLRAIAGAPADAGVRLLLAHQPRTALAARDAGYDLQVCGHTHGGQFLPWTFLVRFWQPFTAGLHRLGRLWVYVSRGTGYWGPPKRLGAPSEITRLRLVPA
jgi:predicted MPP superfamily phosphohydrolase